MVRAGGGGTWVLGVTRHRYNSRRGPTMSRGEGSEGVRHQDGSFTWTLTTVRESGGCASDNSFTTIFSRVLRVPHYSTF